MEVHEAMRCLWSRLGCCGQSFWFLLLSESLSTPSCVRAGGAALGGHVTLCTLAMPVLSDASPRRAERAQ